MHSTDIPMPFKDENDIVTELEGDYLGRAKSVFPDLPDDVISQWLYSHPNDMWKWEWLDLASLTFSLEVWHTSDVPAVDKDVDSAVSTYRYNLDKVGHGNAKGRMGRLVDYFESHSTWPRSPIFLDNQKGLHSFPNGFECKQPYHLIEGHNRMAVFSLFRDQGRLMDTHQIWVAKKSIS